MKFSVLLPTRNRLELLSYAIATVRLQEYQDWEIIVSDNASEEDVESYVRKIDDSRVKYFRTERFVPVTENWNNALSHASGDYVLMLGDDDGLMRGYFRKAADLIGSFEQPEVLYTGAYLFAYPGVMPGHPEGYLKEYGYPEVLGTSAEPHWLDRNRAQRLVRSSADFRLRFGFNMQYFLVQREFILSLREKGPFFQSPYPDYYAANVLFLKARRILVCPLPLVAIGISPKSFGYYYFNNREEAGVAFLNNMPDAETLRGLREVLLPGSEMNTSWLIAMETLKARYGDEETLRINHRRYRFLQTLNMFRDHYVHRTVPPSRVAGLLRKLHPWEKIAYGVFLRAGAWLWSLLPEAARGRSATILVQVVGQYPVDKAPPPRSGFRNILEVFEQVEAIPRETT